MVTGKVRFLQPCTVVAGADGLGNRPIVAVYEPGKVYELSEPSCQRWIRRGLAVREPEPEIDYGLQAEKIEAETQAEAEINAGDCETHPDARISLTASDAMADTETTGSHRRPYRRRTQSDSE